MVEQDFLLKVLKAKFPDAVDMVRASSIHLTESSQDLTDPAQLGYVDSILGLNEIEPETGIYAAMSPITHRVYVYFDPYNFMNL